MLYNGEITLELNMLAPESICGGVYTMGFKTQNRSRLTCHKLDLTNKEIDVNFDKIMDEICGLSEKRFNYLKDIIHYKINTLYFKDTVTNKVYKFETKKIDGDRVAALTSIDGVDITTVPVALWLDDAIKALADIFYVTCHTTKTVYKPGDSCSSLSMYKQLKRNLFKDKEECVER